MRGLFTLDLLDEFTVFGDVVIVSYEGATLDHRLSYKHAVEGISVDRRQRFNDGGMFSGDIHVSKTHGQSFVNKVH